MQAVPFDPAHPGFVGRIIDVDLRDPLTSELATGFRQAMDKFGVCVFRDQKMSDAQQIAFSRLFGTLEFSPHFGVAKGAAVRMKHPELFDVSNLDENDRILADTDRRRFYRIANEMWHTDSSFQPNGASYSLLFAHIVPASGADTEFADMRAAYDSLPDAMKNRIEGLVVEHSADYSRSLTGYKFDTEELSRRKPTRQYLVQTHSGSGRRSLYLASHASHIVGMDVEEGRALLAELVKLATRPEFCWRHRWQVGDMVVWDNRCTMHRATPFDDTIEKRDLRRTTVVGDVPLVV